MSNIGGLPNKTSIWETFQCFSFSHYSADDRLVLKASSGYSTNVKVRHNGNQTWRAHIIYKSMCNINVKYFPFDEQICKLVFASWSQDVSVLDLRARRVAKKEEGSDVFQENEEWTVEWINIERSEVCTCSHSNISYDIGWLSLYGSLKGESLTPRCHGNKIFGAQQSFKLHCFYLTSFNWSSVDEIFWVWIRKKNCI